MEMEKIIAYAVSGATALVSTILATVFKSSSGKAKKKCNEAERQKTLSQTIHDAIVKVEAKYEALKKSGANIDFGANKLDEALQIVQITAMANGWTVDVDEVKKQINELVEWSKKVNAHKPKE